MHLTTRGTAAYKPVLLCILNIYMRLLSKLRSTAHLYYLATKKRWLAISRIHRYILLAIALAWAISGVTIYVITGQRAIATTSSQNSARLLGLSATIDQLPVFSDVKVGETSGLLPHIQSTRDTLAEEMKSSKYLPASPPAWTMLHPAYWTGHPERKSHKEQLQRLRSQLLRSVGDIDKFGKFVAYSPMIDLGGTLTLPDASERLERTKAGLSETRSALSGSGFTNSEEALVLLDTTILQVLNLTPETVADWSVRIESAQVLILDDLHERDILTNDYREVLRAAAQAYQ